MKTLFEILFRLEGANIEENFRALSKTKIDFEARRQAIFEHHLKHSPKYASWLGNCDIRDWYSVPVIKKQQFQVGFDQWIANPFRGKKLFQNSTSGSSGVPLRFAKDWECHALTWALIKKRHAEQWDWHNIKEQW